MPTSHVITNLYGGVSQQPPAIRDDSQCEEQINIDGTLAKGLRPRNATKFIAQHDLSVPDDAHVHFIDRSPTEKWFVIFDGDGAIKIYNALTGVEASVEFQDHNGDPVTNFASNYLTASSPRAFRCLTIADVTLVLNSERVTQTSETGSAQTVESVQTVADLPDPLPPFTIFRILGSEANEYTSYYVATDGDGKTIRESWIGPRTHLIEWSAPWTLFRTGPNAFVLKMVAWPLRECGDQDSVPPPLFYGRRIKDMFFHRNRLGFLTDAGISLSRADGDYFNFWRKSMLAVRDDDPIHVELAHAEAPTLLYAVPFNKNQMIFGDTVQFTLEGGDVLSPRSVAVAPVTAFDCSDTVRPVGLGPNLYFTQEHGSGTKVREFFSNESKISGDAFDVTGHVPHYIAGRPLTMIASSTEDMVALHSQDAPSILYLYRVLFNERGERIQSAWSKWDFSSPDMERRIVGLGISESTLYMVFAHRVGATEQIVIEHLNITDPLSVFTDAEGRDVPIHLDHARFLSSGWATYWANEDKTTWGLNPNPVPIEQRLQAVVVGPAGHPKIGAVLDLTRESPTLVSTPGNWSGTEVVIGIPYEAVYRLSRQYARDQYRQPRTEGRLQLHRLNVLFTDSASFKVRVSSPGRPTREAIWVNRKVGQTALGKFALDSGDWPVGVMEDASRVSIEIRNNGPLPFNIYALRWTGSYTQR